MAEHMHWSVIFWINLPLGLAALAMSYHALRALPAHHRPHKLDVIGAVLMAAGSVTFLLALTWGGTRYPWTSPVIAGLFASALALWAAFAVRVVTTPEPFLPLSLLRNPVLRNGTIAAFFGMGTNIGLSIYVPLYLQSVLGLSASHSGLALIPLMGGTVVGAQTSGRRMGRVARYKRLPIVGLSCGTVVLLILAAFPDRLPLIVIVALLAVVGIAVGSLFPVTTVAIQNSVHLHELGTATATMNFFRQLGGAIIVAAFGAIMLAGLGAQGGEGISPELLAQGGAATAAALAATFRHVFLAAALGFAAALLFLVLMEERPLLDRRVEPPVE
jgi:predicted MFS family arabinose efflux permease